MNIESKSVHAVRLISKTLLHLSSNKLPPIKVLARDAGVGLGTVSKAIEYLTREGAIKSVGVQHYGTTLEQINYPLLWRFSGGGAIKGILPMPISLSIEGLVQALSVAFDEVQIDVSFVYREGASRRLQSILTEDAHFTIMSKDALSGNTAFGVIHEFADNSYYGITGAYRILPAVARKIKTIGVDAASQDHVNMVKAEFPDLTIVSAPMRLIPGLIAKGEIDASVWYGGMAVQAEYINRLRIEPVNSAKVQELMRSPAVVVAKNDTPSFRLLSHLDTDLMNRVHRSFTQVDG